MALRAPRPGGHIREVHQYGGTGGRAVLQFEGHPAILTLVRFDVAPQPELEPEYVPESEPEEEEPEEVPEEDADIEIGRASCRERVCLSV